MANPSPFYDQQQQQQYPPQPPSHQQQQGQHPGYPPQQAGPPSLTPEEKKVLDECSSESFFYRSLPLATLLMGGAQLAVKQGLLKPNPRFGGSPKMVLGGLVGYFVGKMSYAEVCADKFVEKAPHGNLTAMIRKRRGLPELEVSTVDTDEEYSNLGVPQNDVPPSLVATQTQVEDYATRPPPPPSYDELRRRNRESVQGGGQVPYMRPQTLPIPPSQPSAPPQQESYQYPQAPPPYVPPTPRSGASNNKYGDEGFE